jgi:putative pyruvate formate lyase activating enzyme
MVVNMSISNILDMNDCTLCPRNCHADRAHGHVGFCGETDKIRAARAALLKWEEPCLTGPRGSGAFFFCGCNIGCVFCQNYDIAHDNAVSSPHGLEMSAGRMAEILLSLQEQGASDINLITPTHFLPQIIPALNKARNEGLHIPVVYNTGSYEKKEAIQRLDGLIDIYLPDMKYYSDDLAVKFSHAPGYFKYASEAIAEMVRQCPEPVFADGSHSLDEENDSDDPIMTRGVIVRHMALPGQAEDSRKILDYLHSTFGNRIFISIMSQYTPMPQVKNDPILGRRLSAEEYDSLTDYAVDIGIENGFIQDGDVASESFIPEFDGTGL